MKEIGDFFGLHYSRVSRIVLEAKRKTPKLVYCLAHKKVGFLPWQQIIRPPEAAEYGLPWAFPW